MLLRKSPVPCKPLTIRASLKSLSLRLYDEEQKMLVGWDGLNARSKSDEYQTVSVNREVKVIHS
jgi:hypothetical protein